MASEHVVLRPPATLLCLHCAARYDVAMPAPIDIFTATTKAFNKTHKGCKVRESGPACEHCGGFGHAKGSCSRLAYGGSPHAWWNGPDTGLSSKSIWNRMMGNVEGRPYAPADPADFGRCYRLLKAIPGWRERIGEMATVTGWQRLAPAWDELEALYLEELPTGKGPKLFARIQDLERGTTSAQPPATEKP